MKRFPLQRASLPSLFAALAVTLVGALQPASAQDAWPSGTVKVVDHRQPCVAASGGTGCWPPGIPDCCHTVSRVAPTRVTVAEKVGTRLEQHSSTMSPAA